MGASGISARKSAGIPGTDPLPLSVDRPVSALALTFLGTFGRNVAERLVRTDNELGRAGSLSSSIGSSSSKTAGIGMSAGLTS